jgi:hypothetical protein
MGVSIHRPPSTHSLRDVWMGADFDGLGVSRKLSPAAKHLDVKLAVNPLKYYAGLAGKVSGKTIEVGSG